MKFIHTFWSKPLIESKFANYNHWLIMTLITYSYSYHCIRKLNQKIELYTDKFGAEILSFLPYDKIHIIEGLEDESVHFAAQIKFHALKKCELNDILIDGDTFIYQDRMIKYIEELLQAKNDVIFSFIEPSEYTMNSIGNVTKYKQMSELINQHKIIFNTPFIWPTKEEEYLWFNCSFMCINNQELKDKYLEQYFKHKDMLKNIDFKNAWPDVILEQRFLTILSKNYKTAPIIKDFYFDPNANEKAINLGFTHLGSAKFLALKQISEKLLNENPILYKLAIQQIEKHKK